MLEKQGRVRLDSGHHRRILAAAVILGILGFVPVILRLWQLMVTDYDYYAALALKNQSRTTAVMADRGMILDRNLNIMAQSVTRQTVYFNPRELKQTDADIDAICDYLAQLLDADPQKLRQSASNTKLRYTKAAAVVEEDTARTIRDYLSENGISGIHLEPTARRIYPFGSLAAQVIGFTNASGEGCEGVEAAYQSFLAGKSSRVITTKGNNEMDMPYSYENYLASDRGYHIILTLDTAVQSMLENQLRQAIARYDVQNGAFGLVMNCKTGEILAMATLGSYDPNAYQEVHDPDIRQQLEQLLDAVQAQPEESEAYAQAKETYEKTLKEARLKQWRNRVIADGYEPGSTFKVMTMAAALDCGAIDLETPFYCKGAEQIPGRAQRLHCWKSAGHGAEKTPQALQNSCNLAFAHIALKLGGERFYDYISRFGILEKTGIDLAGESKGIFFDRNLIVNTEKWGTASLTSGSFGQTFKITPLQLVRGIASVVNGGRLLEPYLVSEIVDDRGNTVFRQEPTVVRQTISEQTSAQMRMLIQSVVTEGTARNAAVQGYAIGGKTGTSEKIDVFDENGQRVQDKIVSFVGIAPMDDPEYIVLAALDTPSRQTGIYISGGVMAAPTVGAVMAQLLPYEGVEKIEQEENTTTVPDLTDCTAAEARKQLEKLGLTGIVRGEGDFIRAQNPAPGQKAAAGSQVLLDTAGQTVLIPDFTGMTLQQAYAAADTAGVRLMVLGAPEGAVFCQSEQAGTETDFGSTILIQLRDSKIRD